MDPQQDFVFHSDFIRDEQLFVDTSFVDVYASKLERDDLCTQEGGGMDVSGYSTPPDNGNGLDSPTTLFGMGLSGANYFTPGNGFDELHQQDENEETMTECFDKLTYIRQQIVQTFPESYKRPLALYTFYQQRVYGASSEDSLTHSSFVTGVPLETLLRWKDEFYESELIPAPVSSLKTNKRTWLLEEFPDLLQRAQEWVDENIKSSLEMHGRLFRITEFQKWVNSDLLVEVMEDAERNVSPISHSTARSWLNRLGYYEELRALEEQNSQTQGQVTPPRSVVKTRTGSNNSTGTGGSVATLPARPITEHPYRTRPRSHTWTARGTPASAMLDRENGAQH